MADNEKVRAEAGSRTTSYSDTGLNESEDEGYEVDVDEYENESFRAMFMSDHFVFPPSQHENLPLELYMPRSDREVEDISDKSERGNEDFVELEVPDNLVGHELYDGNKATVSDSVMDTENVVSPESSDPSRKNIYSPTDRLKSQISSKENRYKGSGLPCEAWWKRVASFYAQAKEANKLWSVFVAAALMGLVIVGQRYQQGRWQIQHKWQLGINDEVFCYLFNIVHEMIRNVACLILLSMRVYIEFTRSGYKSH
ncbi:hypothetical protein GIB67_008356 [Kingdonia uniflora]|uniref:Uncharacterized protein n=1 Tax=Kingdonia uniflora TaxID=39325 RepID=A0A7J7N523_9MAGN|nr:hypothetical protein GIB67_008356 [Kingdonia uniflora]